MLYFTDEVFRRLANQNPVKKLEIGRPVDSRCE